MTLRGSIWLRVAAAGVLLAGAAGFVACSDDDDDDGDVTPVATKASTPEISQDEQAIRDTVTGAFAEWNANDREGFVSHFTDEGLISSFGQGGTTIEEANAGLDSLFGTQPLGDAEFSDFDGSGDTASIHAVWPFGPVLLHSKFSFVKVGGDWKMNGEESNLPVEIPAGTDTIEVDMNEFAFGVDTTAITEATKGFALAAKNVGKQGHMLALARVPAEADIQALLQEDDPEGVEFVYGTGDVAPGDSSNIVFVKPMDAGRYVMLCFLPDTDEGDEGTPHVFKGMLKEFTVK